MPKKKSAASSQPAQLTRRSEADIRAYAKSAAAKEDSKRLRSHLHKHGGEPSLEDMKDIPLFDGTDPDLFRPVKKPIALRIDADVLAWLKSKGGPYQSRLNALLRDAMQAEMKR